MLFQLITTHPESIGAILKNTPVWVGGLFLGLMGLGFSQARARTASLLRVSIMPVTMTGFSIWGMTAAFGQSTQFVQTLLAWTGAMAVMAAAVGLGRANATYDRSTRSFTMPGSLVPMALILGIFLTKYWVGVELAMQPRLAQDGSYTVIIGGIYGFFSGIFIGRAARLMKLAFAPSARMSALQA